MTNPAGLRSSISWFSRMRPTRVIGAFTSIAASSVATTSARRPAIERAKPQPPRTATAGPASARQEASVAGGDPSAQTTTFTIRSGTTMTRRAGLPPIARCTAASARAAASDRPPRRRPPAASISARRLPLTCTAMVTLVRREPGRIGHGPGRVGENRAVAEPLPELLGEMRQHRADQQDQRLQRLAQHLPVRRAHRPSKASIALESSRIRATALLKCSRSISVGHARDAAMDQPLERHGRLACRRRRSSDCCCRQASARRSSTSRQSRLR